MKKWIFLAGIMGLSLFAIQFALGSTIAEVSLAQMQDDITTAGLPIQCIDKQVVTEKQVVIDADVNVNGEVRCKTVKSKTTDGLIISNIIMGLLIIGILL